MAKKKKNSFKSLGEEIKMDLKKLMDDMMEVAQNIVEEYEIDGEQISGSVDEIVQIHEESPYLKEIFDSDQWKKVLDPNLPEKPKIAEKEDKKDDSK